LESIPQEEKIMTLEKIVKILELHGIIYYVSAGHVYAFDGYYPDGSKPDEYRDLTGITKKELAEWLGY
jgi:hypothetical protein